MNTPEEYKIFADFAQKNTLPIDIRFSSKNEWHNVIYWATQKGKVNVLEDMLAIQSEIKKQNPESSAELVNLNIKNLVHHYYKSMVTREDRYTVMTQKSQKNVMQRLEIFLDKEWKWQWNFDYENAVKSMVYREDTKAVDYLLGKIEHPQKYNMVLHYVIRSKKKHLLSWALDYSVDLLSPSAFTHYPSANEKDFSQLQQQWIDERKNLLTDKFYQLSAGMIMPLFEHFKYQLNEKDCKKIFVNLVEHEYLDDAALFWDALKLTLTLKSGNDVGSPQSWRKNNWLEINNDYEKIYPAKEKNASIEALQFLQDRGFYDNEVILRNLYHRILDNDENFVMQLMDNIQIAPLDYKTNEASILRLEYLAGAIFYSKNPTIWQTLKSHFFAEENMAHWSVQEKLQFNSKLVGFIHRYQSAGSKMSYDILDCISIEDLKIINEKCQPPFYHFVYDYRLKREMDETYPFSEKELENKDNNRKNIWKV
jgi:hypothetical protein